MAQDLVKLVLVGDGAVGKTAALLSFAMGKLPGEYVPTVFDNYTVDVPVAADTVKLALFDTAGQEDYDRMRSMVYPETQVFLVCFSVLSRSSFENVKYKWVPELRKTNPKTPIILVGTQSDLRNDEEKLLELRKKGEKQISVQEADALASELKLKTYKECSALTGEGLKDVFDEAVVVGLSDQERSDQKICCCILC